MRSIKFYRNSSGRCPVEEFLDSLSAKQAQKMTWVMQLFEEHDQFPAQYFEKLVNKKSAISRIENHTQDIRLSTLFKIAAILGKHVKVSFV